MPVALTLLEDVRWRGTVVPGERPRALLAALAGSGGRPLPDERLIELVWGEEAPANATKSLHVLVSRTRAACGADAIVRDAGGYRLGVGPAEVDSVRLEALVRDACAALDHDAPRAATLAREALALAERLPVAVEDDGASLTALRRSAAARRDAARAVLAQAGSRTGAHADALPALEDAHDERPGDESLLADLLRSEAVVRGPGAALERYERYRRDLRARLGTSPGERLQRVQRELLALERPVREGVRHDATALIGRDADLERLRALMASSRVVSIVGAGGLGKTRLAHVLARDATEPRVHVVELAGVTAAEDVVGEVGSVLGVRDSVSGRRALTPRQRADVRARIAQRLGQSPSLLLLDNCEHLIGAVAELVAFLVSAAGDVRVLTTSRAPLAIAAERVYPLGELDAGDAAALFHERAVAARPGVQLAGAVVRNIVVRLDGLPLAIELAAAKVRAMSVEEIDRRLENRFALLRGGDRAAPDRHQTLLAVIDWSWNLLGPAERRALRRLAVFNDGFTLDAADATFGDGALDAVQGLVDQSLLSVREVDGGVRYRMLETVREFGLMQLVAAGEDAEARAVRRAWALAYAERHGEHLAGPGQIAAIDALAAEETNLADELRDALGDRDVAVVVRLLAALGFFWAIRGEHARLLALAGAIADAVRGWSPPTELEGVTRAAAAIVVSNAMITADERMGPIRELLQRLGPGQGRLAGLVRVLLSFDPADPASLPARLERLADDPDREVALPAQQWLSHARENAGDPVGAVRSGERALALVRDDDGPWTAAIIRTQLAQLLMHLGEREQAVAHARAALPVMERLGAVDDQVELRSLLLLCAIGEGRLADAEAELARIDAIDVGTDAVWAGSTVREIGRADLALARGEHALGLRTYRACAEHMRETLLPGIPATGKESWVVFGEATALAAHARHATGEDEEHGLSLFRACRGRALRVLDPSDPTLDLPVAGLALFALGTWVLLREEAPADTPLRLLALADRFAYNRTVPTMAWEPAAARADAVAPGRLAELRTGYAGRRTGELLDEARGIVEQLPG